MAGGKQAARFSRAFWFINLMPFAALRPHADMIRSRLLRVYSQWMMKGLNTGLLWPGSEVLTVLA